MSKWENWVKHPQSVWLRRALFQVHLWSGIGIGLYVLMMSISGSVLIFRRELSARFSREPVIAVGPGPRLTQEELRQAAKRALPAYEVGPVFERKDANRPVEIRLKKDDTMFLRLFNPYTGADLGDSVRHSFRFITWLADLHDYLLLPQQTGRHVNSIGGIAWTILCLTGVVIWWPGIKQWRRSLTIDLNPNRKRFNWSLHSALGFWSILFIFMWGITGISLSLPELSNKIVDHFEPITAANKKFRIGDQIVFWMAQIHFGRFSGLTVKVIWTVLGLVPLALFISGVIMWWNRVLSPWLKRAEYVRPEAVDESAMPRPNSSLH